MTVFYCDEFVLPLPDGHRFPMDKYRRLRERAVADGVIEPTTLQVPDPATDEQLLRVHTREYVHAVVSGQLDAPSVRRLGFPWSPALVERSRRSVGGTIAACRTAVREGVAVNLAGGTHHAFGDRGEGFCVFNDAAVAARAMQAEGHAHRLVVVDCDVHQGNGTAAIFAGDPTVTTYSIHGRRNFPFRKERGDVDVEMEDGTGDEAYLDALARTLPPTLDVAEATLAIYVSGADPFAGDRLGRMSLTKAGLRARDRYVLGQLEDRGIPVAVTMAGGYAREIDDIVEIHLGTVAEALGRVRARGGHTARAGWDNERVVRP